MHGPVRDGWPSRWMDGWMDGWTDDGRHASTRAMPSARARASTIVARVRATTTSRRREDGRREGRRPARATGTSRDDEDARGRATTREDGAMTRRAALGRGIALAGAVGAGEVGATRPARAFIDLPSRLHNRYFFVRHGESVLDVRNGGMILSNPSFKYDTTFGLTARGRAQMQEAAKTILRDYDGAPAWLYTSNFQRSFQSALVLREEIGLLFSQMRTEFSGLLDPRKMGALDFGSQEAWDDVWKNDFDDPSSTPPPVPSSLQPSASVESCLDIYRRALEAFTRLEATYYGEDIIIVSHQDTLSVFAAALNGADLSRHHLDYPFELGQVRCVDLTVPPRDGSISPTDLRGDYAVGDSAMNYSSSAPSAS